MLSNLLMRNIMTKFIVIFLSLSFSSYYIWFRFVRERLPRDIPFSLSLYTTVILFTICFTFIYAIVRLTKLEHSSNMFIHRISIVFSKIMVSLLFVDQLLKKQKLIKKFNESFLLFLLKKINPFTLYLKGEKIYILYFLSARIILLFIFIFDVFYFHQIKHFYTFIVLGLFDLLISYYLYSIKLLEATYFEILDDYLIEITSKDNDPNTDFYIEPSMISYDNNLESQYDYSYNYLTIQHFIDLQCTAFMFDHTPYNYKCLHKTQRQDIIFLESNLQNIVILTEDYIEYLLQILINIQFVFETIKFLEKRKIIKRLKITIYLIYFISWLYILIISFGTFHLTPLESMFLKKFQDTYEPFSNLLINNKENDKNCF